LIESGENNLAKVQELEKQLANLEEQRKKIEDSAKELAQRYAPINLDDVAPLYQQAFSFFQKGDLEQAQKTLQTANYTEQAQKILQERDTIAKKRTELNQRDSIQWQRTTVALQGLSLKADLHKIRFEFDSTARCYNLMIQLGSNNLSVLRQYASFLAFQNQYDKAITYYNKILRLTTADDVKASILNSLGNAYSAKKNKIEAEKAYNSALILFRELAQKNSNMYLPYVALTLNNIGNHKRMFQKSPKTSNDTQNKNAESAFEEALKIYRQVSLTNKTDYQAYIALTLNNLGRAYYDNQHLWRAKNAFDDCLTIYEALVQDNPDAIVPSDIQNFIELSLVFDNNDKEALFFDNYSEKLLNRALKVHRQFAVKNSAFLPIVALSLNNLGFIYGNHKKIKEAEAAYNESEQILQDLVSQNPNTFSPFLVHVLKNQSKFYLKINKTIEAEAATTKALELEKKYIIPKD
jgi:tetratricopeptide (TPR) repeat protein